MSTPEPPYDPYQPHGVHTPPGFGAPAPFGPDDPESDPLVPPPYGGLDPWFRRLIETLRRSWRPLGLILLLTFAVPQVGFAMLLGGRDGAPGTAGGLPLLMVDDSLQLDLGLLWWALVVTVATAFVNSIGWGAGIWAITQSAVGLPITVGAALQAGAARMLPMFGWFLVYGLLVAVGILMCIVPGIYLAVVGSLFSFVVVYERGTGALGRSFALVHQSFGAVLGRVLLLFAFVLSVTCTAGAFLGAIGLVSADGQRASVAGSPVVASVVEAAVSLPVTMVLLVGLLLTYTQARARREPVSTPRLWLAANPDPTIMS